MLSPATRIALSVEGFLVFIGLLLLWRLVLSPAARAQPAPAALPVWAVAPSEFLLFLLCAVCGGAVITLFVPLVPGVRALTIPQQTMIANGAMHTGLLGGIALFCALHPGRFAPSGPRHGNVCLAGLATFLIALPVMFLAGYAGQLVLKLVGLPIEKQLSIDLFGTTKSFGWRLGLSGLAVLVAPLTEELIFRAGFFRFLRTRIPRWGALLLPACVFAALHSNLASFGQLVALGIIFSLAYERTGRIATPIIAHAIFNLHTVLFLLAGVDV